MLSQDESSDDGYSFPTVDSGERGSFSSLLSLPDSPSPSSDDSSSLLTLRPSAPSPPSFASTIADVPIAAHLQTVFPTRSPSVSSDTSMSPSPSEDSIEDVDSIIVSKETKKVTIPLPSNSHSSSISSGPGFYHFASISTPFGVQPFGLPREPHAPVDVEFRLARLANAPGANNSFFTEPSVSNATLPEFSFAPSSGTCDEASSFSPVSRPLQEHAPPSTYSSFARCAHLLLHGSPTDDSDSDVDAAPVPSGTPEATVLDPSQPAPCSPRPSQTSSGPGFYHFAKISTPFGVHPFGYLREAHPPVDVEARLARLANAPGANNSFFTEPSVSAATISEFSFPSSSGTCDSSDILSPNPHPPQGCPLPSRPRSLIRAPSLRDVVVAAFSKPTSSRQAPSASSDGTISPASRPQPSVSTCLLVNSTMLGLAPLDLATINPNTFLIIESPCPIHVTNIRL